jgi:hypothetical protein
MRMPQTTRYQMIIDSRDDQACILGGDAIFSDAETFDTLMGIVIDLSLIALSTVFSLFTTSASVVPERDCWGLRRLKPLSTSVQSVALKITTTLSWQ